MKKNRQFLEGMRCPKCGSLGPFDIEVDLYVRVHDDDVDRMMNDVEWESDDACYCVKCQTTLTVGDFIIGAKRRKKPAKCICPGCGNEHEVSEEE